MERTLISSISKNANRITIGGLFNRFMDTLFADWVAPDINALPDPLNESNKDKDYKVPDPARVQDVLNHYKINGTFKDSFIGPSVTTYEIDLPDGSKMASLQRYKYDIARDLSVPSVRILTSVQGRAGLGIEVPHGVRFTVNFKEMLKSIPKDMVLPILLGEDTFGVPRYLDLVDMPHMLIAGQTGSGKSVFINACIAGLLCLKSPRDLKLVLVDPKRVEFRAYKDIPHLFEGTQIVHEPEEAKALLDLMINEMENRFELFEKVDAKNLKEYKAKSGKHLPHIILVMDEFAELVTMGTPVQKRDVEGKVGRLAQKARAVGIHMILATQYPTREAVTPRIKANMPTRIAFSVASQTNSRVILDENGAEDLLGNGDMLISSPLLRGQTLRIQAPYATDAEIKYIVNGK
jgi:S-DNA-T family DNA segregation ATPase FtsK/SpoIIIE